MSRNSDSVGSTRLGEFCVLSNPFRRWLLSHQSITRHIFLVSWNVTIRRSVGDCLQWIEQLVVVWTTLLVHSRSVDRISPFRGHGYFHVTSLFHTENGLIGRKRRIAHVWAYMLLGQFVAVSVASNLFYVAVTLSAKDPKEVKTSSSSSASPKLYIPIMLSLVTVAAVPYTSETSFLPNLLSMHSLILVPLLPSFPFERNLPKIPTPIFYSIVASISMFMRLHSSRVPFHQDLNRGDPPHYLLWSIAYHHWETLYSHPAQSSIGWDLIWTTISFLLSEAMLPGDFMWTLGLPCVLTVLWGVGFAAPAVLALYSWQLVCPCYCTALITI
jgi:hypothetical protein